MNNSSQKKSYAYDEDTTYLPTAGKSLYQDTTQPHLERTPTQPRAYSPVRGSAKLSEAHRSIN